MPPTQFLAHRPRFARGQQLVARFIFFFICILMIAYPTITLLRSDASLARNVDLAAEDYGIDIDPPFNGAEKHLSYPFLRGGLLKRTLKLGDKSAEREVNSFAMGRNSQLESRTWADSNKKDINRLVEATGQYWDIAVASSPDLRLEPLNYIKSISMGFEKELRSSAPAEEDVADILEMVEKRLRDSFGIDTLKQKSTASTEGVLQFHQALRSMNPTVTETLAQNRAKSDQINTASEITEHENNFHTTPTLVFSQSLAKRDYIDDHLSELDQQIESPDQWWDALARGGTLNPDDIKRLVCGYMEGLRIDYLSKGGSECSEKNVSASGRKLETRLRKAFELPLIQKLAKRDYIDDNTPFLNQLIEEKGEVWEDMVKIGAVTVKDIEEAKQRTVDLLQNWCFERGGPCTTKNILSIERKLKNRLRAYFGLGPAQQLIKKDFVKGHVSEISQKIENRARKWGKLTSVGIATKNDINARGQASLEALQQEFLQHSRPCKADRLTTVRRVLENENGLRKPFKLDPIQRLSKREKCVIDTSESREFAFDKTIRGFKDETEQCNTKAQCNELLQSEMAWTRLKIYQLKQFRTCSPASLTRWMMDLESRLQKIVDSMSFPILTQRDSTRLTNGAPSLSMFESLTTPITTSFEEASEGLINNISGLASLRHLTGVFKDIMNRVDGGSKSPLSALAIRQAPRSKLNAGHKSSPREPGDARPAVIEFKIAVTRFYQTHCIMDIQKFLGLVIRDLASIPEPGSLIEDVSKDSKFVTSMGEWISSSSIQDLVGVLEILSSIPRPIDYLASPDVGEIQNFADMEEFRATFRKALDPASFAQFTSIVTKSYIQSFNQTLKAQDVQDFIQTSIAAASAAIQIAQHVQSLGPNSQQNQAHKRDSSNGAVATAPWSPANITTSSGSILHPSRKWQLSQWLIFGASIMIFGSLFLITLVSCIRRCRSKSRTRPMKTPEQMSMKYGHLDKKIQRSQNTESSLQPTMTTINASTMGLDGVHDGWTHWLTSKPRSELKVAKRRGNLSSIRAPRLPSLKLPKPTFHTVRRASGLDVDIESAPQVKRVKWGSTV